FSSRIPTLVVAIYVLHYTRRSDSRSLVTSLRDQNPGRLRGKRDSSKTTVSEGGQQRSSRCDNASNVDPRYLGKATRAWSPNCASDEIGRNPSAMAAVVLRITSIVGETLAAARSCHRAIRPSLARAR